jgi:hypothetical protein
MYDLDKGAKFLDKKFGKTWPLKINTRKLDLRSTNQCILAQLHSSHDYLEAGDALGLSLEQKQDLGFTSAVFFQDRTTFTALTKAWKVLITARKRKKK